MKEEEEEEEEVERTVDEWMEGGGNREEDGIGVWERGVTSKKGLHLPFVRMP